jgi:hypothetical protein
MFFFFFLFFFFSGLILVIFASLIHVTQAGFVYIYILQSRFRVALLFAYLHPTTSQLLVLYLVVTTSRQLGSPHNLDA